MKINPVTNSLNFQSTSRRYTDSNGDPFGCFTMFFRDDLNWEKLSEFELEHFKKKDEVNVVMFACSDGSEAYSKIISLLENPIEQKKPQAKKFFPIHAFDVDDEIVKTAKSGYIKATSFDIVEIISRTNKYTDYFQKSEEKLNIANDITQGNLVLKAKAALTDRVKFNKGDMFKEIRKIKDNSNTILMCRNILGYFLNDKIEEFIKLASEFLKRGSLFVIGDYDHSYIDIGKIIENNNFKKVLKNVYEKI